MLTNWKKNTQQALKKERDSFIYKEYLHWAESHTPTWETDNLVGNLLGWPKDYKTLAKKT